MRRLGTVVAISIVVLVGAAAALISLGRDQDAGKRGQTRTESIDKVLVGPHSPAPGSLDGRIVLSRGNGCVLHQIDLTLLSIDRGGSARACGMWVSPAGDLAVTQSVVAQPEVESRRSLVSVDDEFAPLAFQPEPLSNPSRWQGSPAWGPQSDRVALCGSEGETLVVELETREAQTLAGCWPLFTPGGSVLTFLDPSVGTRTDVVLSTPTPSLEVERPLLSTINQTILEDGETRLDLATVRASFPARAPTLHRILGFAASGEGRLAVTVLHLDGLELRSTLQFWDKDELMRSVEIPVVLGRDVTQGSRQGAPVHSLRFGPNDTELAIAVHGEVDELVLIDSRTGGLIFGPTQHTAFDWSPNGQWLGVATANEVEIYGPDRSRTPIFAVPISATALAWRSSDN